MNSDGYRVRTTATAIPTSCVPPKGFQVVTYVKPLMVETPLPESDVLIVDTDKVAHL